MPHTTLLALVTLASLSLSAPEPRVSLLDPAVPDAAEAPATVHWHASYDAALAAARVSGKPVMLFQLLGKLDDALC